MGLLLNKRGAAGFLIVIIISIVGGMVALYISNYAIAKTEQSKADEICRAAVAIRAQATLRFLGTELHLYPLQCKANNEITIDAKGKTNAQVLSEIMNYAVRAWGIFGSGSYVRLDNIYLGVSGGNACFRYYNIKITGLQSKISTVEINHFLNERNVSKTNQTYYNYFTGPNTDIWVFDEVEPNNIYSIIFASTYLKDRFTTKKDWFNLMIIANLNRKDIATRGSSGLGQLFLWTVSESCEFVSGVEGR